MANARQLVEAFRYEDAIAVYTEELGSDTTSFDVLRELTNSWNLHGLDLQAAGDSESAEQAFEMAAKYAEQTRRHHPDSAATYVNLAAAYGNLALFRGGKSKVSIGRAVEEYCSTAIELDSANVVALTIMGVFHRELSKLSWIERLVAKTLYGGVPKGSIEKSVMYLERAIGVDSTALFPNYSLAVTLRRMKEHDRAKHQLEKVLTLPQTNSEEARYVANARLWLVEDYGI